MYRSSLARVLVWFVALAGLGLYALAQENAGNVFGRTIDEQGNAIPGATATLIGDQAPRTTVSDTNGNFRFLRVPPGRYKINVTMPGFTTVDRSDVIVSLGKNTERGHPTEALRGRGNGHGDWHDAAPRHAQGPDRRHVREAGVERHPDLPRHLRLDAAGARRAARLGQRGRLRERPGRRARLLDEGLRRRHVSDRRRHDDRQLLRHVQRGSGPSERRDQHVLRLRDVRLRRRRDRRLAPRPADAGRHDQRRDQARHQRVQGRRALLLRQRRPLPVGQHASGGDRRRASRPTPRGSSASTARSSAARSSRTGSGSGAPARGRTSASS